MLEKSINTTGARHIKVVNDGSLQNRIHDISDSIAQRAYQIFESDGRPEGHEMEHWFRAQEDLLHPSHALVEESADSVAVRAEVPGFRADELEVSLEPRRVTITGKRESEHEHKHGKVVYTDRCANQIYRVLDLPVEVDVSRANAVLEDGLLELDMPKANAAPKSKAASA
ncbi:MAG TPA: Hsp20 family protein [Candidatus Acidoferrales bacterium]|jgi:HSP20 family protein|nr:Hsp20 family protein [Candidatus Acidoferrales bacterium]